MQEWTPNEWTQYYSAGGTKTLEEFRDALLSKGEEIIQEKYGSEYMTPEEARKRLHAFVEKLREKYGKKRKIKEVNINGSRVYVENGEVKTVLSDEIQRTGYMSVEECYQLIDSAIRMVYELNEKL
ncbi:MAG: hypothetical protein IJG42_08940 [Muribaculaceae bacterium]|nr:hypothetical protein [Muribaculaceae bacterium]